MGLSKGEIYTCANCPVRSFVKITELPGDGDPSYLGICRARIIEKRGSPQVVENIVPVFLVGGEEYCKDKECLINNDNSPCGVCPLKDNCRLRSAAQLTGSRELWSTIRVEKEIAAGTLDIIAPNMQTGRQRCEFKCVGNIPFTAELAVEQFPGSALNLKSIVRVLGK